MPTLKTEKIAEPRSIKIFKRCVSNPNTQKQYLYHLEQFAKHNKLGSIDSILRLENLKESIEDYIMYYQDKKKTVAYIRTITFALQSFLENNDVEGINWKKTRKLLGKKAKPKKSRPYATDEIKQMLSVTKDIRTKAIILFLSASGVRRGALPELKLKDLKEMPNDCLAITVYSGTDEEYITFINKEAKDMLTLYLEKRKRDGETLSETKIIINDRELIERKLDPESPVFRTSYKFASEKPNPISEKVISNVILRAKNNSGLDFTDSYNMLCHAFRRRFNTILKSRMGGNANIIEKLMGHSVKITLDNSYFQPDLDILFGEYKKGIADLSIDDKTRVIEENRILNNKNAELEKLQKENSILNNRYAFQEMMREELEKFGLNPSKKLLEKGDKAIEKLFE